VEGYLRLHGSRILDRRAARGTEDAAALALDHWRLRRHVRIDAWFIVPQRWLRHLANVWQG